MGAPRRAWWIVAAATIVLVVAGWLASGPLLRRLVQREAHRREVDLDFETASYSTERIVLERCAIGVHGIAGVRAEAERLVIRLDDYEPRAVEAFGLRVTLDGPSVELARALRAWSERHPLPGLTATLERLSWARDGEEWLRIAGGKLSAASGELLLEADEVALFGRAVGPIAARTEGDRAHASLALGAAIATAPVMLVARLGEPLEVDVALRSTPLSQLAGPFGVALAADLRAAGNVQLRFGDTPERGPIQGRVFIHLEGYTPPVPREIRKLAFGKSTEIEASFSASDDRELVSFAGARVRHGVMGLEGAGTLERKDGRALLRATLEGRLLCRDVAASAASAHVDGPLAEWISDVGRAALRGSVAIRAVIDADFARLADARIVPTIGVGCGLRLP